MARAARHLGGAEARAGGAAAEHGAGWAPPSRTAQVETSPRRRLSAGGTLHEISSRQADWVRDASPGGSRATASSRRQRTTGGSSSPRGLGFGFQLPGLLGEKQ